MNFSKPNVIVVALFWSLISLLSTNALAQKINISLSGDYGVLVYSPILKSNWESKGFSLAGEIKIKHNITLGGGLQWQFFEPVEGAALTPNGLVVYDINQHLVLIKPTVKWYFLNQPWGSLFTGVAGNWNYLTSTIKSAPQGVTIQDPSDLSGLGAGVLLGYRYQFKSGFGLFLQGNTDWLWFDIGSGTDAKPLYSVGIGVSKAF